MKKLFVLLSLFLVVFACGQKQQEKTQTLNTQYPDITANNIEQRLFNAVKHYEKEPLYYMRINKINCLIEVLINDYPVHNDYELSNHATPLEINNTILKSGEQKLTYRLYPVGDLIKEEYGEGDTVTTLTDNTALSISIIKMDNKGQQRLEDEEVVMKHTSLNDAKGNFIATGKPYYEFTFEFNAQVPYQNEGWSKGQDLTKLDQKLLEQKALEFYNGYGKIYLNHDKDALAKVKFGDNRYGSVSLYLTTAEIKKMWNEDLEGIDDNNIKIKPLEKYKMSFFGNGKIVSLLLKSLDPTYREAGVLIVDSDESIFMPRIQLYLPEGKKLEDGLYMID